MAEWLGHLLSNWSMWAIVVAVILIAIGWYVVFILEGGPSFLRDKRRYLGEKKHGKK